MSSRMGTRLQKASGAFRVMPQPMLVGDAKTERASENEVLGKASDSEAQSLRPQQDQNFPKECPGTTGGTDAQVGSDPAPGMEWSQVA